jgi:hypothetical protein
MPQKTPPHRPRKRVAAPMTVQEAIENAEVILPGEAAPDDQQDPRWQAIIKIGNFIEDEPEPVWAFVERWGQQPDEDLRAALATCLLEHLLEYHFDLIFPRAERLAYANRRFAQIVELCGLFGQAKRPKNAARLKKLLTKLLTAS